MYNLYFNSKLLVTNIYVKLIKNLFILIVYFYLIAYSQTILYSTFSEDIGGTVEFICPFYNDTESSVLWLKMNREKVKEPFIISNRSTLIVKNPRISVWKDSNQHLYLLEVLIFWKIILII